MTNITEHNSKEEREDGDGIQSRIHFLISGNTISVHNLLEWGCELIDLEICWRFCFWLSFPNTYE